MKIKYIGHACFKVTEGDHSVIFDPYASGSVPGLMDVNETANEVYCSHDHHDHNDISSVKIVPDHTIPYTVNYIETYHDDKLGTLRGNNRITILNWNQYKIAHFGDLGCDLSKEQLEMLQGLDVAMIPVGGFYTINAAKAKSIIDQLNVRVTLPMHYRKPHSGYEVLDEVYSFTKLCDHVEFYLEDEYEITGKEENLVVVLLEEVRNNINKN